MKKYAVFFTLFLALQSTAQSVTMHFPAFAGTTYDFIIFQGSKAVTILQDTIPKNGNFILSIPKTYAPYTGMSRWLLTNSELGGGIDMAIPGHDFSISCTSDKPNESNIVFNGFDAVNELNRLNAEQQKIIDRFETMRKASQLYTKADRVYATFQKEQTEQIKAYAQFRKELQKNTNYNARFLPIVSLINGYAHQLTADENEKARLFNDYFTQLMPIEDLYVSGHWDGIIQSWVQLQTNVIQDKAKFTQDFKIISSRISNPVHYTDFVDKTTYYLTKSGKDDYIDAIASTVVASKKITEYAGILQVYLKAMVGMQAPDLVLSEHVGQEDEHNHKTTILKSSDFAQGSYTTTLLIFYQSGCGPCEDLLQQLPGKYEQLKKKGMDIIAISADEGVNLFKNTSRDFPWSRTYCDLHGKEGINFKNYAAIGTPTMYLVDKKGFVVQKMATLTEVLKWAEN